MALVMSKRQADLRARIAARKAGTNSAPAPTPKSSGFDAFFQVADQASSGATAAQGQTAFDNVNTRGMTTADAVADALRVPDPPPSGGTTPPPPTPPPAPEPVPVLVPAPDSGQSIPEQVSPSTSVPPSTTQLAVGTVLHDGGTYLGNAPTHTPVTPLPAIENVASPNVNDQQYAAAQAAPPTTAGNTAFAEAQDPTIQSLIQRQDQETERQNNLVQNLVYNANTAGQQAVSNLKNPEFMLPQVDTDFGRYQAAPRQKEAYELQMEQALQNMLMQSDNSPAYQAQLQQYNTQAEQDREGLLGLLQSTGNLRGSGTATEQMSKYYGGVSQGRANLLAQQDAARQQAIAQAMNLSGMNQSNELAQGQMVGNLRGARTLQAQQASAAAKMGLADMFNRNQQFNANFNMAKVGLGQDVANQELNRAMTVTSPTQREMFTQQQNQNMIGNELARANLTGILGGRQTMAGQANQANVAGQNLANQAQTYQNQVLPAMLQQQLGMGNYALTGADLANRQAGQQLSQAEMLQPGLLRQQNFQTGAMDLANQSIQQQLDLARSVDDFQINQARSQSQMSDSQAQMLAQQLGINPQMLQAQLRGANLGNDLAGQQLSQAQMLQPGMLTAQQYQNQGMNLGNQMAGQQLSQAQMLQSGLLTTQQLQNAGLTQANEGQRLQNDLNRRLQDGQITQQQYQTESMRLQNDLQRQTNPLAVRGMSLQNRGQELSNDINWATRRSMDQEYGQTQAMNPLLLEAMGLSNTGQRTQNSLSAQALNQQNQMFPEQLRQLGLQGRGMELSNDQSWRVNRGMDQDYSQQGQLFPGMLTQQRLQTRGMELGNDQAFRVNRGMDQEYNHQGQLFPGQLRGQNLQNRGMELGNDQAWKVNRGIDQEYNQQNQLFPGQLTQQGQATTMNNQQIGGFDQQQQLNRIAQMIAANNSGLNIGQGQTEITNLVRQALGLPQLDAEESPTTEPKYEVIPGSKPPMYRRVG